MTRETLTRVWVNSKMLFDEDIAEAITHLWIAMNIGKKSFKDLTEEEGQHLLSWIFSLSETSS
jgi:hypothetical protein